METLHNHSGKPIAYVDDDRTNIYLYSGKPVA